MLVEVVVVCRLVVGIVFMVTVVVVVEEGGKHFEVVKAVAIELDSTAVEHSEHEDVGVEIWNWIPEKRDIEIWRKER